MNARGVEEDELASFQIPDSENAVPGGLRLGGNDGNLLSQDTVEQR